MERLTQLCCCVNSIPRSDQTSTLVQVQLNNLQLGLWQLIRSSSNCPPHILASEVGQFVPAERKCNMKGYL